MTGEHLLFILFRICVSAVMRLCKLLPKLAALAEPGRAEYARSVWGNFQDPTFVSWH